MVHGLWILNTFTLIVGISFKHRFQSPINSKGIKMTSTATNAICAYCDCNADYCVCFKLVNAEIVNHSLGCNCSGCCAAYGLRFDADELNAAYANAQLMPAHQYKLWKWVTYITLGTLLASVILTWYLVAVTTLPILAGLFVTAGMCLIAHEVHRTHRNC